MGRFVSSAPGRCDWKLWIYVPGAGKWVAAVRQPINMGLIAGVLAGLMAISIFE